MVSPQDLIPSKAGGPAGAASAASAACADLLQKMLASLGERKDPWDRRL